MELYGLGSRVRRCGTFRSSSKSLKPPARHAKKQARECLNYLAAGPLVNTTTEIINLQNIIQVRSSLVTKGSMAFKILSKIQAEHNDVGMIFCMGDFLTRDNDVFHGFAEARVRNACATPKEAEVHVSRADGRHAEP